MKFPLFRCGIAGNIVSGGTDSKEIKFLFFRCGIVGKILLIKMDEISVVPLRSFGRAKLRETFYRVEMMQNR